MMKAALLTLGLTVFLAAAPAIYAQAPGQQTAVDEAVYRQANRIALRQKLAEASSAQGRRDLPAAAKLYDEAWELVQKIGPANIKPEAQQARAGLVAVRFELAQTAQRHGDYRQAGAHISDVLRVDSANADALQFKRANEALLDEQRGRTPTDDATARGPTIVTNQVNASSKVQDGKFFLEMGQLEEAEKKLREAIAEDSQNQAAYYYLNLVSEARFKAGLNRRDVASRESLVEIENAWATPPKRDLLPTPNPYAQTNLVHTGKGRQSIYAKLDTVRLPEVKYERMPLTEVVLLLNEQAKRSDREKRGLNFILSSATEGSAGPAAATTPGAVDPTTGLPIPAAAPAEARDMSQVLININPPLLDVRLADALDAIVKVADPPIIKYSVEEYAVVFAPKGAETTPLHIRTFKIDPNTFFQGLEAVSPYVFGATDTSSSGGGGLGGGGGGRSGGGGGGSQNQLSGAIIPRIIVAGGSIQGGGQGGGGGGQAGGQGAGSSFGVTGGARGGTSGGGGGGGGQGGQGGGLRSITRVSYMQEVSAAAMQYFNALGVDFESAAAVAMGKSLFFNDRQGVLIVRATPQDLDMIEAAIQVLNVVPPEVNIKAKFVEVNQSDAKALGFDWYLGNVLMNNQSIGAQGGTAPSFRGAPSPANPTGVFPGNAFAGTALLPSSTDQILTSGLRNSSIPSLFTLTGVLTDPQFRVVMHALEQRTGADVVAAPEVTTLSGRQAQLKATDVQTIIISYDFSQTSGGITTGGGTSDRNAKQDFAAVDPEQVLAKVAALPITEWSYKADAATRHIGPMAQDFYAAFNIGPDDKHIGYLDASGVALAAIKGLNEKNEKLAEQLKQSAAQIQVKDAEIEALKQRLDKLEQKLSAMGK